MIEAVSFIGAADADLKAAIGKLKTFGRHLPSAHSSAIEQLLRQLRPPEADYRERFLVKSGQRYFSVQLEDIAYFFYRNRVTFLKTWKKESYYIAYVLDEMLSPRSFFRANRQFLVHVKSVKDIHPFFNSKLKITLQPAAQEDVPVSRERAVELKT